MYTEFMKRATMTILFAVAMFVTSSAESFEVGNFKYTTWSTGVICTGLSSSAQSSSTTSFTIPGRVSYNSTEYRVLRVSSYAFRNKTNIKSIRLGWGIDYLEGHAFEGCTALTSVYLPSSLENVGADSFKNCSSLITITVAAETPPAMPNGWAFTGAKKCTLAVVRGSVDAYNNDSNWSTIDSDGSAAGFGAYDFAEGGCRYVMECTPDTPSGQGECRLVGIETSTTSVALANNIFNRTNYTWGNASNYQVACTSVDDYACQGYSMLQTVTVNTFNAKRIGNFAFQNCSSLLTVKLYGANLEVGNNAFADCPKLNSLTLYDYGEANGVKRLGNYAFKNTGITTVYIPSNTSLICVGTFAYCPSLTLIEVSADNEEYSSVNGVLYNKNKTMLEAAGGASTAEIAGTCTYISYYAFAGNTALTNLTVPYGVTTICDKAFDGMTNLKSLVIPSSTSSISATFGSLPALTDFYINRPTPPVISLTGVNKAATVHVPRGYTASYSTNAYWKGFAAYDEGAYDIATANKYFTVTSVTPYTDTNVMTGTASGTATMVKGKRAGGSGYNGPLTIPATINDRRQRTFIVNALEAELFMNNTQLSSAAGGEGIKTIGKKAFAGCTLMTSATIPNPEVIQDSAFYDCKKLTEITPGNRLTRIGRSAFLATAISGEITLPATMQYIDSYAFFNCQNLTLITLMSENCTLMSQCFNNNSSNFKFYVPLRALYRYCNAVTWIDITTSKSANLKLLPFVVSQYEWEAISCFRAITIPYAADFYLVESYTPSINALSLKKQSQSVAAGTGLLMNSTPGTVVRFNYPTTFFNYDEPLKGITGEPETVNSTSTEAYYYFVPSLKLFRRITSATTIPSGSAYLVLDAATATKNAIPLESTTTLYPLTIAGEAVTSDNCGNITADGITAGQVSYDPSSKTLTLNNATIHYAGNIIHSEKELEGLTINIVGTNSITQDTEYSTAIRVDNSKNFTLTGSGNLTVNANNSFGLYLNGLKPAGGYYDYTMAYIKNTSLTINNGEISSDDYENNLTIENSTVYVEKSIYVGNELILVNCSITQPAGAVIDPDNADIMVDGERWIGLVVITPGSAPTRERGDVNGDGFVNAGDVTELYSIVLGISTENQAYADINGDGSINAGDISELYAIIIEK